MNDIDNNNLNNNILYNRKKVKLKKTTLNYIPQEVLNSCELNNGLHPLINQLNVNGFTAFDLSIFLCFRTLLFALAEKNSIKILNFQELKDFIALVLRELYKSQ